MKTAFLFLFFFVAASASLLSGHGKLKSYMKVMKADKDFLIKNGNLLRLMNNIMTSNINDDQLDIAKGFMLDQHIDKFDDIEIVKDFIKMTRFGMLPKSKIFSLFDKKQKKEAVTLFRVLYSAKDFETFYRTACWAREHINEGMFIYALTVAIIHRDDTRGMTLPTPYEIKPNLFINTEIITKAQRLKMQGLIQDKKFAESLGIYKFDDTIFIKSNYSGWYTRPNKEIVMTYFTEDIGLNTFLYYLQTTYPTWMGSDDGMITTRRGELFLYTIQQLLARYYMERLSNGLGEIPNFMWTEPIKTGFKSSLRHINGMEFPSRPNDFLLYTDKNIWDMLLIRDYERRISDAIDLGKIETEKGEIVTLRKPEDIEKLGNIIQGNKDNVNSKYFKKGYSVGKKLLGNGDDIIDDFKTNPSVMQKIETTGRDPMFYQFIKRLYHFVLKFKENLKPYKREDVGFDGVMVEDIQVDKLVTFFDYDSVDITNCVPRKLDDIIHGDKFKTLKIKAIQKRLNHLPFNVKIDIKSDKATETVVRIFLGPKYDSLHRRMKLDDNRINFMEIDTFIYDLKMGMNTILRKSRDFFTTKGDFTPTHEVMKKLTGCIHGSDECFVDMTNTRTGFPDRLLIPRGTKGGMDMLLYVVITPIRRTKIYGSEDVTGKKVDDKKIKTLDMFTKRLLLDDNAFGFPLDRKIDETIFWNTNMLMRDVTIYHKKDIKVNLIDKDIKHDDDYKMMDLMDKIKLNDNDYDKYDWEDWRDDKMSGWKNTKMSDWTDWKDDKMYGRKDTMMSDWKDWKDDKTYDWKNGKMTDFKDWKNYKNMDWRGDNKIDWTDSRMYDTDNYKKGMNYGKKYDSMEDKMIDSREYTKYGKMYDTDYYSKFDTKHGMKYDSNEDKTHDFKDYTKYGKVYDMDYYRKFDTKHGMKYDSNEDKTHDFKDYTKHGKVYDMDYNKKFDTKYGMKYDSREDKMYDSTENRMYNRRDKMDFMKDKMDFMKDKTDFDDYKMHTLRGNKYGIMDKFYKW